MTEYPEELKERAKKELLEQFDLLCGVKYGKIEINFNARSKSIDIVPSPHYRIEDLTDRET